MATRILFVDDEPDLELLVRQKFRKDMRKGLVEIDFAADGVEALAKIDAEGPEYDVVFTDINMPRMNGLELLTELGARGLSTAVLVLSAYGDMENIRTAMNRGAFDFLTKPIDFRDLEITRDKALRHVASQRERARLHHEKRQLEDRALFVRETFGRYLSDSVVQTLLDAPDGLRLGGERREVTVLISDLRGFTELGEQLPPESVVSLLNAYFGRMTEIVMEHGGTIDELLGDAMLVIFGAPLDQDDHADRAVACALAMQAAMQEVNEQSAARGLPALQMGIGIDTGELVVGNIGSLKRSKYGVVGRHVNLAARIEGLTRGGQVLISDDTRRRCTLDLRARGVLSFDAKGFAEPVTVHDLAGLEGGVTLPPPEDGAERGESSIPRPTEGSAAAEGSPPGAVEEAKNTQNHLATIGLMIAGIAHDIRNPLGFIINFSDLSSEMVEEVIESLGERGDPQVAAELESDLRVVQTNLEKIKEHGTRANELVHTMVETLRGTRGPAVEVDLGLVVSRHLDLFESSLRTVDAELELEIVRELDESVGRVRAPPQDLGRILLNLVQNAYDAASGPGAAKRGGEPPRIVVRARSQGETVELRVRDNGPGISAEVRRSMFEPFFTTKGSRGGMGLGLSFVRTMVEAMGGTITVETEVGRFTEMVVTLPRVPSEP